MCRKWVLTLGLMAVTPGISMAAPRLPFFNSGNRATPARSTPGESNQQIADDIASALRDAKIAGYDIAIEQTNGIATLSGKVANSRLKAKATEIVRQVRGVKRVDNQLKIIGSAAGSPESLFDRDMPEEPIQRVNFQAPAPGRLPVDAIAQPAVAPENPFGQQISTQDNQAVAQKIADALAQAGLSGYDVEVRYMNGTALLAGTVRDASQRAKAEQAAASVAGVNSVANRLMVPGQQFAPQPAPQRGYPARGQFSPATYQPAAGQPMPGGVAPPQQPYNGGSAVPMPLSYGHPGAGAQQAVFNSPNLPEYAWPSYASYPNYSQVTYPKDYSASAWPYIGPFYPYPQVPLGWRQVQLEWDDGSWNLNFRPRTDKWWWFLNPKNW
jgi:osmotically-inducible protein OsmY